MTFHRIRLGGPWQARVLSRTDSCADASTPIPTQWRRLFPPDDWNDWLGPAFRGSVLYRRAFGKPTGLTSQDKVWLVLTSVLWRADVELNGENVGQLAFGDSPLRFDATRLLLPRNRLEVTVQVPADYCVVDNQKSAGQPHGLIGRVQLEIESTGETG